jgi:WD40 repeat protein
MQLFLSYSSADRTSVMAMQKLLKARGVTTFLDRDNLVSGLAWPQALEQALRDVAGVAVFIGSELGGWQKREMWFALDRQVRAEKEGRPFPVIPVLLHGADLTPSFLFLNTWIDLRRGIDDVFTAEALDAFEQAIKATKPVRHYEDSAVQVVEYPGAAICPYRGLQIFREEDAAFFAGRKAFAKQLFDFTLGKNLVAVVGPSGSGKSSVVQAGLIPLLRRERPPANTWDAVTFTPGDDPFHRLASALIPFLEPDLSETARLAEAEELGRNLAADKIRVEPVIKRVIQKSNGTGRLLLVADQFEELFTNTPEADQLPFAKALLNARGRAPVTIVITLRADFYSQIISLDRELSDVLASAQVNIGALTPDELRESITAPARLVGLEFESGLVDRILTDVGSEPGRLPLVEFALTEIWQGREERRLTNQAYDNIKGVSGALARRAETEFTRLSPEEQTGAQRLFSRLVQVAKPDEAGEDTRQRTELSEADTLAKRVAKRLADARLLVTGSGAGTGTISVEVAHEVLIRNWERLRGWLNEDREFLLWRQRLSGLLKEWKRAQESVEAVLGGPLLIEAQRWFDQRSQDLSDEERGFISASRELRERLAREEREREERELEAVRRLAEEQKRRAELSEEREKEQKEAARKLRRLAVWAAGGVLIASILAVISIVLWRKSEKETRIALSRQIAAQALADLPKDPQRSLVLAVESIAMTQADGVFVPTSANSLLQTVLAATGGLPLSGHTKRVVTVAFSPSGNWLATGSADGTARLWKPGLPGSPPIVLRPILGSAADSSEVSQGPGLPVQAQSGTVTTLSFSADSQWLVTCSQDGPATLWDLASPDIGRPVPLPGYPRAIKSAAFSPTGRWLATAGEDGTVRLWDLNLWDLHAVPAVAEPKRLSGHLGLRNPSLVFSGDGSRLAEWALFQTTVLVWNITADGVAAAPLSLRHGEGALAIALSRDGSRLAVGNTDYNLHLWDLTAAPMLNPVVFPKFSDWGWIGTVAFSPDGHRLAAAGSSDVRLWDLTASDFASRPTLLRGHTSNVRAITFSADSRWLVTAGQDADARLWDLIDPTSPSIEMHGHEGTINAVAIDPDGHRVATASDDRTTRLWTIPDPSAEPTVLHEPGCAAGRRDCAGIGVPDFELGAIRHVAFSRDGRRLATAGRDKTIRLWRLTDPIVPDMVLSGHGSDVNAIAFSPDGHWLAATYFGHSDVAWFWDLTDAASSAVPIVMGGHQNAITALAFSPGGRWFATGSWQGTIRVWELAAGTLAVPRYVLSGRCGRAIAFSADDKRLASVDGGPSGSETVGIVWDMTAADPGSNPIILRGHKDVVIDVAVSPTDGRWVATASWDHTARLWDRMSANSSANPVIIKFADRVNRVAFSPDGHWLAAGGWDGLILLLDVRHPAARPVPLRGPQAGIFATVFSPDGHWFAVSTGDNSIWLWDPDDLALEPTIMHGHTTGIAFSPDSRWLATGSPNDAATRLWSLDIKELMTTACHTAGRNLTEEEWQRFLGGQAYHKTSEIVDRK